MPTRRGISLGELLLTMSACTVILTMSAALIHRAMHAQSKARAFFDVERSAFRLASCFRQDVHAAERALTDGDNLGEGVVLQLELPGDQTIEYRQAAGKIERVLLAGESVLSRSEFAFPEATKLTAEQPQPRLVVLSLAPPQAEPAEEDKPLSAYSVPLSFRAEAVLHRHPALVESADRHQPEAQAREIDVPSRGNAEFSLASGLSDQSEEASP